MQNNMSGGGAVEKKRNTRLVRKKMRKEGKNR